jgi:hypothetical protein
MLQHVGTFGTPSQILTDNGTQFVNELVAELLKIIGVQHLTILAYSKEEVGIVERANREVLRHLRNLVFAHNEIAKWSKHYVPLVQRIMNTSRVDSHQSVPAELLFGSAITLDRGVLLPATVISDNRRSLSTWAADMLQKQRELLQIAKATQQSKDQLHIAESDPRRTTYAVGEYVLVEHQPSALVKGRAPNKLLPNLRGPFRVRSRTGDRYSLTSLIDGREEEVHLARLHPYYFNPRHTSPRDAAMRDVLTLFEVEAVLDHSGDGKLRSGMDFLVKFRGYDEEYNLWLPYSELRDNRHLHEYLIRKRMKSLIPPKFRENYRV